jgi:hypothetical protein
VNTPASPTQWLYGLYVVVLVTGSVATTAVGRFRCHELDASTGASDPHDFTARQRRARQSQHRIPPHGRDDRDRPLVTVDGRSCAVDLPDGAKGIFLIAGFDTISENQK